MESTGESEKMSLPSGLGDDTAVIVFIINQPGSAVVAVPGRMRKSLRAYWFSLKTPLREARFSTQAVSDAARPRLTRIRLNGSHWHSPQLVHWPGTNRVTSTMRPKPPPCVTLRRTPALKLVM